MINVLIAIHVLVAIAIIGLVLLQHGKGADAGAAFGSGASATVFGARGSGNFLTKATSIIAALFFATCLALAYMATNREAPSSIVDSVVETQSESQPSTILQEPVNMDLPPVDAAPETSAAEGDLPPAE